MTQLFRTNGVLYLGILKDGGGSWGVWTHYKSGSSLLATNMYKGCTTCSWGDRKSKWAWNAVVSCSESNTDWAPKPEDSLLPKHIETKTNRSFEFMTIPFCYASNHFHTLHSFSLILNLNFWDKVGIWVNRRHLQMSRGQEHELGSQTHGAYILTAPPISR